jgi:hypothetical protein
MEFAEVFKKQIESRKATRRSKKLLEVINSKPSRSRTRILERLERHARVHLEGEGVALTNGWEGVGERDWDKFFDGLLKFIMKILPLLLAFI